MIEQRVLVCHWLLVFFFLPMETHKHITQRPDDQFELKTEEKQHGRSIKQKKKKNRQSGMIAHATNQVAARITLTHQHS